MTTASKHAPKRYTAHIFLPFAYVHLGSGEPVFLSYTQETYAEESRRPARSHLGLTGTADYRIGSPAAVNFSCASPRYPPRAILTIPRPALHDVDTVFPPPITMHPSLSTCCRVTSIAFASHILVLGRFAETRRKDICIPVGAAAGIE